MWLWELWRWLRGTVEFHAQGGLVERFLTLLTEGTPAVKVWNVRRGDGAVTVCCAAADYARVRPYARRTGTRVRAVAKRGAPFLCRPLFKHPGLIVGAAGALAVYLLLASYIWVVDIHVDDPALKNRIAHFAAENGVAAGKRMNDVDIAEVRLYAIGELQEINQLSLYFDGSVAHIDVQLQEDSIGAPDLSPVNIVAAHDGLIVSMKVTKGNAMVKAGGAVVKGDLLVSGAIETDKGVLLRHSSAVIMARTTHVITQSVSQSELLPTSGRVYARPTLCFLTWRLPLYSEGTVDETWTVTQETRFAELFGVTLPVGIDTLTYTEQTLYETHYTKEEAERLCKERLEEKAAQLLSAAQVEDVQWEGQWEGDTYHLKATYTCLEDIAKTSPIFGGFGYS